MPTAAVLDRPPLPAGPDGVFAPPTLPRLDVASRAAAQPVSMLRRMATAEEQVAGGVAMRTDPVPFSYQHNILLLDAPVAAATVVAEADRALVGPRAPGRPAVRQRARRDGDRAGPPRLDGRTRRSG